MGDKGGQPDGGLLPLGTTWRCVLSPERLKGQITLDQEGTGSGGQEPSSDPQGRGPLDCHSYPELSSHSLTLKIRITYGPEMSLEPVSRRQIT